MKFNRIAVCLRGHIRNWNYTKDKFFYFYKEIANEVHYYYATWDLPYIESTDLNFTFNNNQVGVLVSPKTDHYVYGSRVGPAYLSSHIRLVDTYDAVVDTRFDMIPVLLDGQLISIDDMTIETSYANFLWGHDQLKNNPENAMCDTWGIMTQNTYEYYVQKKLNFMKQSVIDNQTGIEKIHYNEVFLQRACDKLGIKTKTCTWMDNFLARPSLKYTFLNSLEINKDHKKIIQNDTWTSWPNYSKQQKINYCIEQGIYINDYV